MSRWHDTNTRAQQVLYTYLDLQIGQELLLLIILNSLSLKLLFCTHKGERLSRTSIQPATLDPQPCIPMNWLSSDAIMLAALRKDCSVKCVTGDWCLLSELDLKQQLSGSLSNALVLRHSFFFFYYIVYPRRLDLPSKTYKQCPLWSVPPRYNSIGPLKEAVNGQKYIDHSGQGRRCRV